MADLSTILGKEIHVFRFDWNESREGFCRRGRGRSFHVDGPKTEKASSASRPRPAPPNARTAVLPTLQTVFISPQNRWLIEEGNELAD